MNADIQFALDRAQATNAVALAIMADWEWAEKSVVQMDAETQALEAQVGLCNTTEAALVNAINQKKTALANYHTTTVLLLGMAKTHYRNQPAALATLKTLQAPGKSEQDILDEGAMLAKIWEQVDATYVPDKGWTLTAFKTAGTTTAATFGALTTAEVAASNTAAETSEAAANVEDTNMAWYADATKKFGPDTPHGVMIRQMVPTTTRAVRPPDPPVVIEAQALGGGKVHIDFAQPKSGWIQIWHQGPGETAFTVVVDKLTALFWEQGDFKPGAHSFKFIGINSGGKGDETAPITVQVT